MFMEPQNMTLKEYADALYITNKKNILETEMLNKKIFAAI